MHKFTDAYVDAYARLFRWNLAYADAYIEIIVGEKHRSFVEKYCWSSTGAQAIC